ncbi:MAG: hemerythrin domain-containing protein [Chitinophagaceae bacterium]|nr:hemerythrin domain-containing protein [Chitinophagaceae bacterium]
MKRHPVLARFSREHHKALLTAQYIKTDAPAFRGMPFSLAGKQEYVLRFFQEHLKNHFQQEEAILFLWVRKMKPEMAGLIDELVAEHRAIETLIRKIESNDDIETQLDVLGRLMELHIRKEERILFQQLQEKLSTEEFAAIENQLTFDNGK